jgi:hypothetical protein
MELVTREKFKLRKQNESMGMDIMSPAFNKGFYKPYLLIYAINILK